MAEAFPEDPADIDSDNQEKLISVLLLATRWQFDTYGLSTVNKSLVNNLRVVDPEAKKIKITCAVVEEDGKIENYQKEDAEKFKVHLKGAKRPRGPRKKPNIEWLENNTAAYYLDLVRENSFDFIIGHVPYLANGALNLKDIYNATENKPKVILMIHDLPRTTDGDIDEEVLLEWFSEADVIFSVGKEVKAEVISSIASLPSEERPIHKLYIPGFPLELFGVSRDTVEGNTVQGTQSITMMTGDRKDLDVSGMDFPLAFASAFGASKHILEFDGVRSNFQLLIDNKDDKDLWKKEFKEIIQKEELRGRSLQFYTDAPETLEKIKTHLRKSNLFVLPLKPHSPLFGAEALSAVAAGVPVLVSAHSGMASTLARIVQDESIVQETSLESDQETWKDKMIQKLLRAEESQGTATRLRDELLLDSSIAQSHIDFTKIVTDTSCVRLKLELDSDFIVGQEHIDNAVKFGISLYSRDTPIEAKDYILAFIQKLLLQREKLEMGLLTDYLQSGIAILWQEVLSTLENSDRKVMDIQSGSLVFTLLCLTISSAQELKDNSWIETLKLKMEELVKKLGFEALIRIRPPEDVTHLPQTDSLLRLRKMKLRHTAQSEGYETMTEFSSDIASEIFQDRSKVMEWLEQQPDLSVEHQTTDASALNLLETIKVSHIKAFSTRTTFSISEFSSHIGIASRTSKPSLSVMYPGTDKPPHILSRDEGFKSTVFIKTSDKEYLAVGSDDEIRLWDLENNASRVTCTFNEENDRHLSVIDERTVACVTKDPSSDGFNKVYLLNTDSEKVTLSGTLQVKVGDSITDVCFVKTTDGTACLLLSCPEIRDVKCVEIIGGKVRWQQQQMGGVYLPRSICTDGSTVFVADLVDWLHLLSVEDGSLLTSINLLPFGLQYPSCVRLHGEHLYVGHMSILQDTYCISKFTKPSIQDND